MLVGLFNDAAFADYAGLTGALVFFWVVSSFLETVAVANQETRLSTAFIICANLTKTLFMLGAALAFGSLRALAYASLAQGVLQTAVLLGYLESRFPRFWRTFDWGMLRAQLAYAMPLGFAGLLYTVQTDLHNYFVSHRFSPADFAVYSVGCLQDTAHNYSARLRELRDDSARELLAEGGRHARDNPPDRARDAKARGRLLPRLRALHGRRARVHRVSSSRPPYLASWPIFVVNLTLLPSFVLVIDPLMRAYAEHRYFLLKLRTRDVLPALRRALVRRGALGVVGRDRHGGGDKLLRAARALAEVRGVLKVSRRDLSEFADVAKLAAASLAAACVALAARALMSGFGRSTCSPRAASRSAPLPRRGGAVRSRQRRKSSSRAREASRACNALAPGSHARGRPAT